MSIEVELDKVFKNAGLKVYHKAAPEEETGTFTVYRFADTERLMQLSGYAGLTRYDVVFESWGKPWQAAVAQNKAVIAAIDAAASIPNKDPIPSGENTFDENTAEHGEVCAYSIWFAE